MTSRAEGARGIASVRATLITLLTTRPRAPLMSGGDAMDRLFLLDTCLRTVLTEVIWFMAGANREEALKGLDTFFIDMRADLKQRADGKIDIGM